MSKRKKPSPGIGCYPSVDRGSGTVEDAHGNPIGTCRVVGFYKTPRSYLSSEQISYRCILNRDGSAYYGRGAGKGMLLILRRMKQKRSR